MWHVFTVGSPGPFVLFCVCHDFEVKIRVLLPALVPFVGNLFLKGHTKKHIKERKKR